MIPGTMMLVPTYDKHMLLNRSICVCGGWRMEDQEIRLVFLFYKITSSELVANWKKNAHSIFDFCHFGSLEISEKAL